MHVLALSEKQKAISLPPADNNEICKLPSRHTNVAYLITKYSNFHLASLGAVDLPLRRRHSNLQKSHWRRLVFSMYIFLYKYYRKPQSNNKLCLANSNFKHFWWQCESLAFFRPTLRRDRERGKQATKTSGEGLLNCSDFDVQNNTQHCPVIFWWQRILLKRPFEPSRHCKLSNCVLYDFGSFDSFYGKRRLEPLFRFLPLREIKNDYFSS